MPFIAKNMFLTQSEMEENARFFRGLAPGTWSINAISALMGNAQSESTINPGIWENLEPRFRGYGLFQWSPWTKLTDWIMETWPDVYKTEDEALQAYNEQVERLKYESENGLQWFSNPAAPIKDPPISLSEFLVSDKPPGELADYFLWFYEHPATTIQPNRAKQAEAWYKFFTGTEPPPYEPPVDPGKKSKFKIIYYTKLI